MADPEKRKISRLMRETLANELRENGETTPGAAADIVIEKYGETVDAYGRRLARAALSQMASGQLRSWFAVSLAGEVQPTLPGIPDDVMSELPPTITVPGDDDANTRHVLLSRVTLGEVRAYERMLEGQRRADAKRHRAIRFVLARAKGKPDSLRLQEALGLKQKKGVAA